MRVKPARKMAGEPARQPAGKPATKMAGKKRGALFAMLLEKAIPFCVMPDFTSC